ALPRAERLLYAAKQAGRHRILDSWQSAAEAGTTTPLNRTSPAVSTLRTLLQFIAGNGDPGDEPDLQALLNAAIACVPGAEAGSISVRGGEWSEVRVQSGYTDDLLGARHTSEQMLYWHGQPAAWQAGQPRVLTGEELRRRSRGAHAPDSPEQRTLEEAGRQNELQANILIPVRVQGNVYAELNLDSLSSEDAFDAESLKVAEEFGLWAAAILSASIRVRQALSSQDAALLTLGVALEARDMETQGHTRRVVDLATDLGRALNLGAGELHMLRQGAALHDLGKLLIPDRILLKAGPLTPDEWDTMKTHATLGADLAAQLTDLMPAVLDVIRSHHERWDGSGYPQGLRGDDIPLLARIFSVCDVFDALTSARPYKDAWSSEAALAEIAAQAGRQFDPQVVRAFLSLQGRELGRPA
ncbi:HD-GYP domain-containing protein, partial [Deinococcus sp. 23YEL01]|uniref:HD-GYP domain-containing protein n=1 Tax=Deinococcus sp. 23YEL01 TaxID=2745871 RepID=UPI00351CC90E